MGRFRCPRNLYVAGSGPVGYTKLMERTTTQQITLTDVTAGNATVNRNGRPVGRVHEDKAGSSRTGTRWTARVAGVGRVGTADTRTAAVALIAKRFERFER